MSGVSFNSVGNALSNNTNAAGSALTDRMNNNFDSSNPTHMMDAMRMMNNWSLAVNLESSTVKMIADTLKGVVQKIG
ncbi:MAG: type III secretion system needle filament subunit SctF [Acetobacteraceae bacterium]